MRGIRACIGVLAVLFAASCGSSANFGTSGGSGRSALDAGASFPGTAGTTGRLNIGSDDATIVRSPGTGATTTNVAVVHGANSIGVAPNGKHAVVYFNASASKTGAPTGSVLQDLTVIAMGGDKPAATNMTVGFK